MNGIAAAPPTAAATIVLMTGLSKKYQRIKPRNPSKNELPKKYN